MVNSNALRADTREVRNNPGPIDTDQGLRTVLQGTFDIFSLTELIAMLAGGAKTGTLEVHSGSAHGRVHLKEGLCSGVEPVAELPASEEALAGALVELCFELARESDGEFHFLTEEPPMSDHLVVVDEPLVQVARLLDEWQEVHGLIPSLDLCPQLSSELEGESITLSAGEWAFAVSLDGRATVSDLVGTRAISLLELCQEIAALVERGAVRLNAARAVVPESPTALGHEPVPQEAPAVVPVAPYGPGVEDALGAGSHPDEMPDDAVMTDEAGLMDEAVMTDEASLTDEAGGESLDGDDVKDRGALLRMFSALRDA